MDFYTLAYVESQAVADQTWGFIILVTVLLALLVLGVQVLRNGLTSRYRDLMVILWCFSWALNIKNITV